MTPFEIANSDGLKTQFLETGKIQVWVIGGKNVDQYVDAIRALASEFGWEPADLEMNLIAQQLHVEIRPLSAHVVTAEPVEKFRDGIIGYRFRCSCGKEGHGHHSTEAKAISAGQAHFRSTP